MTNSIKEVVSGVDWITLTGRQGEAWDRVQGMAHSLIADEVTKGQRIFRQSRHGFSLSCVSGVQVGKSKEYWMLILSSEFARKYWHLFAALAQNCTRIDLQTTIWYNSETDRKIRDAWQQVETFGTEAQKRRLSLIANGKRGDTLYVGSRMSAQFGRFYDKGKQSRGDASYSNSLRFEVEYKKPLSGQVVQWLLMDEPDTEQITARVLGWFSERGVAIPQITSECISAIESPEKVSTIEKKLEWLRKTVGPTYRQLRLLGWQTEADNALGVTDEIEQVKPIKGDT